MKQAVFPTLETDVYVLHKQIEKLMGGRGTSPYLWSAEPIGGRMQAITIRASELPAVLEREARLIPALFPEGAEHRFSLTAQCAIRRGPRNLRIAIDPGDDARRLQWLERRALPNGFELVTVEIASVERIRIGKPGAHHIADRTRFEGTLRIVEPQLFQRTLRDGIGHGKAFGLGLLDID